MNDNTMLVADRHLAVEDIIYCTIHAEPGISGKQILLSVLNVYQRENINEAPLDEAELRLYLGEFKKQIYDILDSYLDAGALFFNDEEDEWHVC
tara:strand:- start:485 stop:766 length:282 start_codon:yes stop_codon:yes gene_type:complete